MHRRYFSLLSLYIKCIVAIVLFLFCQTSISAKGYYSESVEYAQSMKMGINIGNSLDAYNRGVANETCWGNGKITQETLNSLKSHGFTTVRIPVTWLGHIGPAPTHTIENAWMDRVAEVVGYAKNANMRVIVNIHHDGGSSRHWLNIVEATKNKETNEAIKSQIKSMWTQIAERFKDEGEYLMFESFNELHDGKWGNGTNLTDGGKQYEVLNEWNQVFVDAVRSVGGENSKRFLGVPGYCTNIDLTVKHFRMPRDKANRILVSVHNYDPYDFTLECKVSEWGKSGNPAKKASYGDEQHITSKLQLLHEHFVNKGIGVYVGEMGAAHRASEEEEAFRKEYLEYICHEGARLGIPMIYWENGTRGTGRECEGLFDHHTGKFFNNGEEIAGIMTSAYNKQLAFPTAEGYGKYTRGGRGGRVFEVANLNDKGKGSLREAVEADGPRTVVFRVSGTIDLQKPLKIRNPYITIAGQTAPGDGICIKRYPLSIDADEVIIRYIRVRLGDESGGESDAISSRFHKNIILDHVSASWSVDETMSIYWCDSVTIQWCVISESLYGSNHVKGHHGFGGIWGSDKSTYHHNLLAHHSSRNPRFSSGCGDNDYRNNVVYNWGFNSCYGGGKVENKRPLQYNKCQFNMVANYYKPGPATTNGVRSRIANPSYHSGGIWGNWYIADNFVYDCESITKDNWSGGVVLNDQPKESLDSIRLLKPWPAMHIRQQTAEECFETTLQSAGCSFPSRDAVDERIVKEVKEGTATYEGTLYKQTQKKIVDCSVKTGIIDSQNDVGGWPMLTTKSAPKDSDHDGMPDEWEKNHGLNPKNANDANKLTSSGYTYLELYINDLPL